MPINDNPELGPIPTIPDNLTQAPHFGSIIEVTKDCMVLELRHFFKTTNYTIRTGELPRIDKYSTALDPMVDPLETAVNLIRNYPDITENLPLIAVMATTGQNNKLGLSDKYVNMVIPRAQVIGGSGPYTLTDGMTLSVTTQPNGVTSSATVSNFVLPAFMFVNVAAATIDEVINCINLQALYCTATKITTSNGTVKLGLFAGSLNAVEFPNKITINAGSTAAIPLGFIIDQTSQNYGGTTTACNRENLSANLTVGLEVVTESDNIRTELSDLLFDFFTFVLADRQFQFYGRSVFDQDILDETYQIIIKDAEISLAGEQEVPRPNDPKNKVYVNRVNIPVTTIMYTDRIIMNNNTTLVPQINVNVQVNTSLPEPN